MGPARPSLRSPPVCATPTRVKATTVKSYHEPIDVTVGDDGLPRSLRWRRRVWCVLRILDRWVLQSRWWAREERRDYLLLQAGDDDTRASAHEADSCILEIYRRRQAGHDAWILARIVG